MSFTKEQINCSNFELTSILVNNCLTPTPIPPPQKKRAVLSLLTGLDCVFFVCLFYCSVEEGYMNRPEISCH